MKVQVVFPSKTSSDPLIQEGLSYLARLRHPFSGHATFLNPKSSISEDNKELRMKLEGDELLAKTENHFRIALTDTGKPLTSLQFARQLEKLMQHTSKTAFIIGGAFGLSDTVIKNSNTTLSLSPMTLPHRLAFLVLCEQIYRAQEIIRGTLYHK